MLIDSYSLIPGPLTPVFLACSTNAGEGLVKLVMCSDIGGRGEEWHILSVQLWGGFQDPRNVDKTA